MKSTGDMRMGGELGVLRVPAPRPRRARSVRIPRLGRVIFTDDPGDGAILANEYMMSNLQLVHRGGDGAVKDVRDLGSGLVTNIGVNLMANDFTLATAPALKGANFHAIGTGATAAAASDFYLQTAQGATSLSGTTNGYMTGAQSWGGAGVTSSIYKTAATFTFTGAVAVTEWVLANANGANFSGTATATGNNTLTNSGATFTTTGTGLTGWTVEANASAINTSPTTTAMGQVVSNTGTALTILGSSGVASWLHLDNSAAANPSGTTGYVVYPSIWDHKVFAVVNAASGDTIQFTYSLTINSNG